MPKLSIIVPIYNGEEFLNRCIDSILSQRFRDFELILVDDGSTDGSLAVCRDYEKKDSRVIVFHKENGGLVSARKSGLAVSSGEYIGFVDCDDYIDDDMYSTLMQTVQTDGSDIVLSGIEYNFPNGSYTQYNILPEGIYDHDEIVKIVIPNMFTTSDLKSYGVIPSAATKVFRREVLEQSIKEVWDVLTVGEDIAISVSGMMRSNQISIIEFAAYHYVRNEHSMTRGFDANRIEDIGKLYEWLLSHEGQSNHKYIALCIARLIFGAIAESVQKSGYKSKGICRTIKGILNHSVSDKVLKSVDMNGLSFSSKVKIWLMRYRAIGILIVVLKALAFIHRK